MPARRVWLIVVRVVEMPIGMWLFWQLRMPSRAFANAFLLLRRRLWWHSVPSRLIMRRVRLIWDSFFAVALSISVAFVTMPVFVFFAEYEMSSVASLLVKGSPPEIVMWVMLFFMRVSIMDFIFCVGRSFVF